MWLLKFLFVFWDNQKCLITYQKQLCFRLLWAMSKLLEKLHVKFYISNLLGNHLHRHLIYLNTYQRNLSGKLFILITRYITFTSFNLCCNMFVEYVAQIISHQNLRTNYVRHDGRRNIWLFLQCVLVLCNQIWMNVSLLQYLQSVGFWYET